MSVLQSRKWQLIGMS